MIDIKFTADPLPPDFSGTLQDFQDRFLLNLTGHIAETQVLLGQVGGAKPLTNVGPWLNDTTWYVWNGSEYVPATVRVGGAGYTVQLGNYTSVGDGKSSIIASRIQLLQDKDGTVALLSDVYEGRPAIVLTGTTPTIDWSQSHNFTQTLTGNTTVKMSGFKDGQEVAYAAKNDGTSYTVTFPSYVFWPSGAPSQTASKTDLYLFRCIGGTILGRQVANY